LHQNFQLGSTGISSQYRFHGLLSPVASRKAILEIVVPKQNEHQLVVHSLGEQIPGRLD
jgi:hypothetical protein